MKLTSRHCLTFAFFLLSTAASAYADPPDVVGRISYSEGNVSLHTPDQGDWAPAALNYPVIAGDDVWTEPGAKSEIQIGAAEIRLDQSTELAVTQLTDSTMQLQVPQGTVNVHLRGTPPQPVTVTTPLGQVSLTRGGSYHIDSGALDASGNAIAPMQVTVLEGAAQLQGPRGPVALVPGETAMLGGNPPTLTLQEGNATPFDNWALLRERREAASGSAQYVSPQVTGYEDLDAYGQWASDPQYGAVWYPAQVAPDWAPYRYGHWAYVAPWGWTWIDNAPWGFAPFHYGRWVQVHDRWGWLPGQRVSRPVYAPALVAFIGGAGWSVSGTEGRHEPAVGWVPLGPSEPFHPYYPASRNYTHNINAANAGPHELTHADAERTAEHYMNRQAMTVVPQQAFTGSAAVHHARIDVAPQQLAQAPVVAAMPHLQPTAPVHPQAIAHPHEEPRPAAETRPVAPMIPHLHATVPNNALSPHVAPPAEEHRQEPVEAAPHAAAPPHPAVVREAPPERPMPVAITHATLQQAHEVPHPVQQTHIAPTPQGWVRTPAHPAPKPSEHPHPHEHHPAEEPNAAK